MRRDMEEKGLEHQLREAGNKLLNDPLSSIEELLLLLNQVESCLSRVDQAPRESMRSALHPSMKALIGKELLMHSNTDVKVAVASCISEITRITAPDAPYNDELMEEIFQMTVAAFENLYDMSSASYSKSVSILKTMANVRSCVVMLDLECHALILQMFHHFLKAIRESHPENVFSSMETIMTLVLEESEDISSDLLSCILTSVKKDNEDVLPNARRLGEKVIGNCAVKLKPYLIHEVQLMGICLDDYSKILTLICQETADPLECNDLNCSRKHMAAESKLTSRACSDVPVLPQVPEQLDSEAICPEEVESVVDRSPTAVMSNSITCMADDDSSVHPNSPKKRPGRSHRGSQAKITVGSGKSDLDHLDSSKMVKPEHMIDQDMNKRRARKTISVRQAKDTDHSRTDDKKDTELAKRKKDWNKEIVNSFSEVASIIELAVPSDEQQIKLSSPARANYETISAPSPSQSQSLPDASRPKRGLCGRKKGGEKAEASLSRLPSKAKGILLFDWIEDVAPQSTDVNPKKDSEGINNSEVKTLRCSLKNVHAGMPNDDEVLLSANLNIKKEDEAMNDLDAKLLRRSRKNVNVGNATGDSVKQQGGKTMRQKGTPFIEKCVTGEPNQKTSEMFRHAKDLGENIVGSKIKVLWPRDKTYYSGIVDSFNPVEKKHKIVYDDGDVEILQLKNQKWELIIGDTLLDGKQETEFRSPDASETQQQKKVRKSSDSSIKQAKTDAPFNIGDSESDKSMVATQSGRERNRHATKLGGISKDVSTKTGSKSNDYTSKTGRKSKNNASSKVKDETPETGLPLQVKEETLEAGILSKDDSPRFSRRSKDGTPKANTKSKGDTWKCVRKSNANDFPANRKSGSLKTKESEDFAKGKLDSTKTLEGELKSGRKRWRKLNE